MVFRIYPFSAIFLNKNLIYINYLRIEINISFYFKKIVYKINFILLLLIK